MNPPIPRMSREVILPALGDIVRAAASFGAAEAEKKDSSAELDALVQYVAQAIAILRQAPPTEEDLALVMGP